MSFGRKYVSRLRWSVTDCRWFGCDEPWDLYISWVLVSTGLWLVGIFAIRYTLKALLSYHAWMYEHQSRLSLLTKLWMVVVLHLKFIIDNSIIYKRSVIN